MQSARRLQDIGSLQVKNEILPIGEDEIQTLFSEAQSPEDPQFENQHNGGTSKLIYYFEPQQKPSYEIKPEHKSK